MATAAVVVVALTGLSTAGATLDRSQATPKSKGFWSGSVTIARTFSGAQREWRDSLTFSFGAGGGKQVGREDWEQAFSWHAERERRTQVGCPGRNCCEELEVGTGGGGPLGGPGQGIWGIVHVVTNWGTFSPTYTYTSDPEPVLTVQKTGCGAPPRTDEVRILGFLATVASGCGARAGACRWTDGLRTLSGKRTTVRKFGAETQTDTQRTAFTLLADCDHDGTPDLRDESRC